MLHISEYDLIPVGEKEALKTWKKKSNRKGIKRKKKRNEKGKRKLYGAIKDGTIVITFNK